MPEAGRDSRLAFARSLCGLGGWACDKGHQATCSCSQLTAAAAAAGVDSSGWHWQAAAGTLKVSTSPCQALPWMLGSLVIGIEPSPAPPPDLLVMVLCEAAWTLQSVCGLANRGKTTT